MPAALLSLMALVTLAAAPPPSILYAKRAFPYPLPPNLAHEWIRAVAHAPDDPKAPFVPLDNTIPILSSGPPDKPEPFYTPTWKQIEGHFCPIRNLLWGGRAGTGKAARLSTVIPTPAGYTTMGALSVGDLVYDEQGNPCRVEWKSPVHVDPAGTFRVVFDDGSEVVCGGSHEWLTFSLAERRASLTRTPEYRARRRANRPSRAIPIGLNQKPWTTAILTARNRVNVATYESAPVTGTVRTTTEIAASVTVRGGGYINHSVPLAGAWAGTTQALPIDPYVLGAWLGDGASSCGQITSADPEVLWAFEQAGYEPRKLGATYLWGTRNLKSALRSLGVLQNKHVPAQYLVADRAQRLALLQGLMDTDGHCGARRGSCEFCNTNEQLARDVFRLAVSLGIKATFAEGRATLYGRDISAKYRVAWTSDVPVFRLERKAARLPKTLRATQKYRYITHVERIADEPLQCIGVDSPSHLYLCGEVGIPTHNSHWLRMDGHLRCLTRPKFRALLLRRNMTELRDTHLDKLSVEAETLGAVYRASETTIVYPNGSRFRFGHCDDDNALKHYLSSEFDWIGLDEGATFTEFQARWIQSRLRTLKSSGVIPFVRIGSNPGAMWLVDYYIDKTISEEHDPSYEPKDYHFIPATITDNPHVNLEEQELRLNGLPSEALRRMYRDGDWHAVEGQFFTDWQPVRRETGRPWHVIAEMPRVKVGNKEKSVLDLPWIEIVRSIDWGFAYEQPGVVGWYACLPGPSYIKFKEWVFHDLTPSQLAKGIVARSKGMKVRYTVGDPVMFTPREGEAIAETIARNKVPMLPADNDRPNGWVRVHSLLMTTVAVAEDPDDPTQMRTVPTYQVLGSPDPSDGERASGCPYTVRTYPMAKLKPLHPNDLELNQDHALDGDRYFAMSRPSESRAPKNDTWAKLPPFIRAALMKGREAPKLGSHLTRRRHGR